MMCFVDQYLWPVRDLRSPFPFGITAAATVYYILLHAFVFVRFVVCVVVDLTVCIVQYPTLAWLGYEHVALFAVEVIVL
jgi:hypothetical protein